MQNDRNQRNRSYHPEGHNQYTSRGTRTHNSHMDSHMNGRSPFSANDRDTRRVSNRDEHNHNSYQQVAKRSHPMNYRDDDRYGRREGQSQFRESGNRRDEMPHERPQRNTEHSFGHKRDEREFRNVERRDRNARYADDRDDERYLFQDYDRNEMRHLDYDENDHDDFNSEDNLDYRNDTSETWHSRQDRLHNRRYHDDRFNR